ncbi:MAG: FtsX-like permease family protein, partial [Saprospiraceae bacterium]
EEVNSILLSETMAKKYFGLATPIGKTLVIKDGGTLDQPLNVKGVFKDFPVNSHLLINFLVSYKTLQASLNRDGDDSNSSETAWGWYDFYTYLKLRPGTNLQALELKFPAFCDQYINGSEYYKKNNIKNTLSAIPLQDIHLYSNYNQEAEVNGNGQAVSFLFIIGLIILLIAWVNYINLSTARSVERAKEVGVRKVMGAQRSSLISQFILEGLLVNIAGLLLALVIFYLSIKSFDSFVGKSSNSSFSMTMTYWILFGALFLLGTLFSGLYPAFVMSGFQPVKVLKGVFKNSDSGILLRKTLIISQFMASVILIAGTIIVYKQVEYMRDQKLGADINQTLVIEGAQAESDSIYKATFDPFKTTLLSNSDISSVTASTSVMGKEIYWTSGVRRVDIPEAAAHTMYHIGIDYDFIPTFKMTMAAGRNYSREISPENKNIILTETGAKELGFTNMQEAINKKISRGGDTLTIIGIVASYHHQGLQKSMDPMIMLLRPNARSFYSVKINGKKTTAVLAQIQSEWNQFFPSDPFNYFFLSESYNEQYKGEILFGKVFGIFALLGIIIACFGLLGLSAYNVVQRTKEIGIRKVIGASNSVILQLLTKDFLKLIFIALVIAIPLCWFIMHKWLSGFAYRTDIPWWIFAIAGGIALSIAFFTISFQAYKAILSKPAMSLR